ncbi:MAG: phage holin family protein [bacterium]
MDEMKEVANREPGDKEEQNIGELLARAYRESVTLIQKEIEFSKVEILQKVSRAGRQAALLAIGAMVGLVSLLALTCAAVAALALYLQVWAAALIVAGAFALIGGAIALTGIVRLRRIEAAPRKTLEALREDKEWLKTQIH